MTQIRNLLAIFAAALVYAMLTLSAIHAQTVPDPEAAQMPPAPSRTSEPVRKLTPAQVLSELKRGGYVLYFRHASTDMSQNDTRSRNYEDCGNQRNLIDRGRDEARTIGAAIRTLQVPIDKVIASPLCRTMETARLAFGRAEGVADVRGASLPPADPERYTMLKQMFSSAHPRGSNLVIVSHGNPFYGVAGPPYLAEGEAAVIRGLANNNFEVVARIRPTDWSALLAAR
jgi:phosphohistidine phosphatase SixA